MKTCYVLRVDNYRGAIADLYAPGELFTKWWCLSRINVPEGFRGKGIGSQLLKEILVDADKEKQTIALEIVPSGDMDYDALEAWYKRYGFEHANSWTMIRRPK